MSAIEPYEVSVPGAKLEGLAQKLSFTNLPDELEEAHWNYGAPLTDVKRLSAYWKDGFNWKDIEAKINKLPNYCTTIQADGFEPLKIHFVHQKSEVQGAIPLLFCHGCKYIDSHLPIRLSDWSGRARKFSRSGKASPPASRWG